MLYGVGLLAIICWVALILFNDVDVKIDYRGAAKQLTTALSIVLFIAGLFIKWLWRIPAFQGWLVPFPNLNGTWTGTLQSTWINPETQKVIAPIQIALVIDQNFLRCTCTLFTKESSSVSYASSFIHGEDGTKLLSFAYTNTPKVVYRNRSQTHSGTALLKAIQKPGRLLEGEYWTNRNTSGDIALRFKSKEKWQKVPDSFGHPNESAGNQA
jgi:hypothetical protein